MKSPTALLLCALAGLGVEQLQGAQAPVDADLLEFLGSMGEDDDWQDYLEDKPVKAVTDKPVKDTSKTAAKSPEASGAPATSEEKDK